MNARQGSVALVGSVAVVGLIGYLVWQAPETEPTQPPTARAVPVPIPLMVQPLPSPAPRSSVPAAFDAELAAMFTKIRATFEPNGSKPNRFRIQRELSIKWGDEPPLDVLLHEATDPTAPRAYRIHFASRLRQLGKKTDPATLEMLVASTRDVLDSNPAGAPDLANALLSIDDSPQSIESVARLLGTAPDDSSAAGFLSALTLSNSPEAKQALLKHTETLSTAPDQHPASLVTALPTLARIPEYPIEPLLDRVLTETSHPRVYEAAIASALARPPGPTSLTTLQLAHERTSQFDAATQVRLNARLRSGLIQWRRRAPQLPSSTSSAIDSLLNSLP